MKFNTALNLFHLINVFTQKPPTGKKYKIGEIISINVYEFMKKYTDVIIR